MAVLTLDNASDNMIARMACLVVDPDAVILLDTIFGGVDHHEKRQMLDNPEFRNEAIWERLAKNFFNSYSFAPENEFNHVEKIKGIDPSEPPAVEWSAKDVRSIFSALRTKMSILVNNFKRSGQIAEGIDHADGDDEIQEIMERDQNGGEGDDEDYCNEQAIANTRYKWDKDVYLFVYLVYGRSPPN